MKPLTDSFKSLAKHVSSAWPPKPPSVSTILAFNVGLLAGAVGLKYTSNIDGILSDQHQLVTKVVEGWGETKEQLLRADGFACAGIEESVSLTLKGKPEISCQIAGEMDSLIDQAGTHCLTALDLLVKNEIKTSCASRVLSPEGQQTYISDKIKALKNLKDAPRLRTCSVVPDEENPNFVIPGQNGVKDIRPEFL